MNTNEEILGTFNGQTMLDTNGKLYPVPANYASKSKLVEGDTLKLTITNDAQLIYKQIVPAKRKHVFATVVIDERGHLYARMDDESCRNILMTTSTYFKLKEGDRVIAIIPADESGSWASIESVLFD